MVGEKSNSFFSALGKHKMLMAILLVAGAALIFAGTFIRSEENAEADVRTEYERALEARIESLCRDVAGVDEITVLVTADRLLSDRADGDLPAVRGVAVAVSHGDDGEVKLRLTELIATSLGIPKNRVAVAPHKRG